MTIIWCMVPEMYGAWQTEFFVIVDHFLHFYPPSNPKNPNFDKMKEPPENIITLHTCTINDDHMMYASWVMKRDRQNFLSFWSVFLPFYPPPTNLENQNIEKMKKKAWRYYDFTQVYHKWQSYNVWFLRYEAWQTEFLSFWTAFCPFTPLTTQKIKILKNWRYPGGITILHMCTKIMIISYTAP